jgi:MinD superfamily P-loop ATPase
MPNLVVGATQVYHCPECGSAAVDLPTLDGGCAGCRVCGWKGPSQSLLSADNKQGNAVDVITAFMDGIQSILKNNLPEILKLLVEYGFMDSLSSQEEMAKQLARYGKAMTKGMVEAIVSERERVEKDRLPRA